MGNRRVILGCAAAAVSAISATTVHATVWDRGAGTNLWANGINWDTNAVPTSADAVFFPTPVPSGINTITLSAGEVCQGIIFQDSYSLSGGDLTLFAPSGGNLTTVAGTSCSVSSAIKGNVGLIKGGPGILTLTGANSFSGTVNVAFGDLIINSNAALGLAGNPVTISSGSLAGTLDISGASINRSIVLNTGSMIRGTGTAGCTGATTIAASASVTLASGANATDILTMGSPSLHISGGAGATVHIAGAGVVYLPDGNSNYTGDWQVDSGTLRIGSSSATSGGTSAIPVASGATLEIFNVNWGRNLTLNNGSTLRGTGAAFYGSVGNIADFASVTLAAGPNPSDVLSNSVVGSKFTGGNGATIHIVGPGSVQLFQPSSFLGDWQVDSGTLYITDASNLGSGASPVVVNNTGVLQFGGGGNMTRPIVVNGGGTVRAALSCQISSSLQYNAGSDYLDVASGATLTMFGAISATASSTLRKSGSGVLLTSNSNSFLGALNIENGTLRQTAGSNSVPNTTLTVGAFNGLTGNYELVNGSLNVTGERIGDAGAGNFLQSGGTHTVSGALNPLWIASGVGVPGSYSLSGGILNVVNNTVGANGETVGFNGPGTFTQTGGTHTVGGANGNLVIGFSSTGVGTYTISNGLLQPHSLYLGRDAGSAGTLNVNGGIVNVDNEFLDLGLNVGATGTVNVNGGSITAQGIYVGGISSQARGAGTLSVNSGFVVSNGELRIWDTPGSAVTISGASSITTSTFNTSGNPSRFFFNGGTLNITGPGGFTISTTGALGNTPTIAVGRTLNVSSAISMSAGSSMLIAGRVKTRQFTGSGGGGGDLEIIGDGSVVTPANGGNAGTSYLGSISISPTATLDLADNDLVVNNTSFTAIRTLVLSGFGNPSGGITSSTSNGSQILALFDNALIGASSWNGTTIGANAIVGKYTYFGDVNFDGQVTGDDYTIIDSNLNSDPPPGLEWLSGDANLDGIVTGDDYTTIDSNLGQGVGNPLSASALTADFGEFSRAVPEPAAFAPILSLFLAARRVRRKAREYSVGTLQ